MHTKHGSEISEIIGVVDYSPSNPHAAEVMVVFAGDYHLSIHVHAIRDSLEARARLDELGINYMECVG